MKKKLVKGMVLVQDTINLYLHMDTEYPYLMQKMI